MHAYLFPAILAFGKPFTGRKKSFLEVEVGASLLLGHSGDSILWSKTEVHLCGFLQLIHCMRDGDFEVKFAPEFRMGFRGSNNLALPPVAQSKQTQLTRN